MHITEQIDALATALAKAQGQIEDAAKDKTNPHFKSKYADLASIRQAIRGPLSENGIAYVQLVRTADGVVEIETVLMHESGQRIGETLAMPLVQFTPQAVGSAISYGRRYALMAAIGLAADDDDAEAAHGRGFEMAKSAPPRKSSAQAKRDGDWSRLEADLRDCGSVVSVDRLAADYRRNEYQKWSQAWRDQADEAIGRRRAELLAEDEGGDDKLSEADAALVMAALKAAMSKIGTPNDLVAWGKAPDTQSKVSSLPQAAWNAFTEAYKDRLAVLKAELVMT